jgi:hypothetical protein
MSTFKWILLSLGIITGLAVFVGALVFLGECLDGQRDWQNYKHTLQAKGEALDWNDYIPPPVPDDQNFFKAPKMREWFVKDWRPTNNEFENMVTNEDQWTNITDSASAAGFLAASDQYQPDFDLIHEALKRPYARMDGDYSISLDMPMINIRNLSEVIRLLGQRAKCQLLICRPERALDELTMLNDLRRIMEFPPAGRPTTMLDAMLNAMAAGIYTDTIAFGMQHHVWQEAQLEQLQIQLDKISLEPVFNNAFQADEAGSINALESTLLKPFTNSTSVRSYIRTAIMQGWLYQNILAATQVQEEARSGMDVPGNTVSPRVVDAAVKAIHKSLDHFSPYHLGTEIFYIKFNTKIQQMAFIQDKVIEAQIACALERYRLANGAYPNSLDALAPQFIGTLPHDIIDGGPLIYRPTSDGKFLLYSIGWNEIDDGGKASPVNSNGAVDVTKGDWVWQN